jgi:hypothetical protein
MPFIPIGQLHNIVRSGHSSAVTKPQEEIEKRREILGKQTNTEGSGRGKEGGGGWRRKARMEKKTLKIQSNRVHPEDKKAMCMSISRVR